MSQKKLHSFAEACTSTTIGFWLSYGAGFIVYPLLFGVTFSPAQLGGITAIFTVISILRGYVVRRVFNWFLLTDKRS